MELEEAAEILLENRPWLTCTECEGRGRITKTPVEVGDAVSLKPDGTVYVVRTCAACRGNGSTLCQRYKEACHALGMTNHTMWTPVINEPHTFGIITSMQEGMCDVQREMTDTRGNLVIGRHIVRMKHDHDH